MSNRGHEKFGAAMLDIDHFKVINDNEGHAEGDRILTQISSLLQQNTREHDICIRLGGDEFVVLLPNCTEEQYRAIADRILQRTRDIFSSGGRQVSVSIGLTVSSGKPNLHAVIKKADAALYQAKKRGRDQIAVSAD